MGQEKSESDGTVEFVCPTDLDVRSRQPGKCRRCSMALVPGIPDGDEYLVAVRLRPGTPRPAKKVQMAFTVTSPKTGKRVTDFQVVHERLYHLFIVSQDLQFFLHDPRERAPVEYSGTTLCPRRRTSTGGPPYAINEKAEPLSWWQDEQRL